MNKLKAYAAASMLAGIVALGLSPRLRAWAAPSQSPQAGEQQPAGQNQQGQKTQAFVGQVIKAQNGRYALLTDKSAGRGYFLDDQTKAKNFDGKTVKVTGTVDAQTKTIHVAGIQPI